MRKKKTDEKATKAVAIPKIKASTKIERDISAHPKKLAKSSKQTADPIPRGKTLPVKGTRGQSTMFDQDKAGVKGTSIDPANTRQRKK